MVKLKVLLGQSFEITMTNIALFVPFVIAAACGLVIGSISLALSEAGMFGIFGRGVLIVAMLLVLFVTFNWGLHLISSIVRTRRIEVMRSFELSLPYLIRFVCISLVYMVVTLLGYIAFLYLSSLSLFLGGAGLVVFALVMVFMILNWGLAKEALYYDNASFRKAFRISGKLLKKHRGEYVKLVIIMCVVFGAILALSFASKFFGPFATLTLGPFGALVLVIGGFLFAVWKSVTLSVFYRNIKLGRHT